MRFKGMVYCDKCKQQCVDNETKPIMLSWEALTFELCMNCYDTLYNELNG